MVLQLRACLTDCCHPQGKMIMQDKLEKERNDAKNAVEEYVYEMRDKLSSEYEKFVTEDVSKGHSVAPPVKTVPECVRRGACVCRSTVK